MNVNFRTDIIPVELSTYKVEESRELDYKAICVFVALGFFLDQDTYWKDRKSFVAATNYKLEDNIVVQNEKYFEWHYTPRDITFNKALDEFTQLFEQIIREQVSDKKVILPLSGGLDSRTQAAALSYLKRDVYSYSYSFKNGFPEYTISKAVAQACDFQFQSYTINSGYLWEVIDELAEINQCYSDFTNPRQMAIYQHFEKMGDVFSLGHWGDVLFDNMKLEELSKHEELEMLYKKVVKKGGVQLASTLWQLWNIEGDFEDYLRGRLKNLLQGIDISNTNAKLRAFKSMYWAPKWTSNNLSIFAKSKPITLPYYDNRMCEFICTVPEAFLTGRQLQIAYIKLRNPQLGRIMWQDKRPFNLYNYERNKTPYNIPYRLSNKLKRVIQKSVFRKPYVQRNWELQFVGKSNEIALKQHLLNSNIEAILPKEVIENAYSSFITEGSLEDAHAMNMLLVLAKFSNTMANG